MEHMEPGNQRAHNQDYRRDCTPIEEILECGRLWESLALYRMLG